MRLIIDTDAGVDDAQAILMALAYPGVTVEAITTLTGNVHVDKVIPNVFTILDITGRDVPVYRGTAHPLLPGFWKPEERVHGTDGLGDLRNRPVTSRRVEGEPAATALVRLANELPGDYTLVALGPLTNIALACRLDPEFPYKIGRFVLMGGTVSAVGNTPSVTAEFNFWCDPEAALITLDAFPQSTLITWEATVQHPFSWAQYDRLAAVDTRTGRFFRDTTYTTVVFLRETLGHDGYLLPDPLAMAVALNPAVVQASDHRYTTVETQGRMTRGQGVVDHYGALDREPNGQIITGIDTPAVYAMFEAMLG
ncbi:MAG: nucleoside hydrolase [Anaerolineae bacterium]|nr:nucleoside hydrolase [Anaerolineae bacterium]